MLEGRKAGKVKGAAIEDGMLKIKLVREVPEAMKPRQIAIKTGGSRAQAGGLSTAGG